MDSPPEGLTITVQSSRYHTESSRDQAYDIDLKGLTITVGQRDLLTDATLKLNRGTHYGLVGRNGVGKSILMRSLANGWIPGIDSSDMYYVEQIDNDLSQTPLDLVIQSDFRAVFVQEEIQELEHALETSDNQIMQLSLLESRRMQLAHALAEGEKEVIKISGARGADARKRLLDLEHQMENLSVNQEENAAKAIQDRLKVLYESPHYKDSVLEEARAKKILLEEFGFTETSIQQPLKELSGGWQIRAALATAVFLEPKLLLLDEPTNHLDLLAIQWLIEYIQNLPMDITLIIVSHDRHFLDATVDEIILFRGNTLTYHAGNYDTFVNTQEEQMLHRAKLRSALQRKREAMEQSIKEGMANARKTQDDKKVFQMASKKKKLDERFGMEKNAKGHRFKLNRDRVGHFSTKRYDVPTEFIDSIVHWDIPEPSLLTQKAPLLQVEDVSFAYPGQSTILSNVTLTLDPGSRMAFVGANGEGKTTLMSILAQKLQPTKGFVKAHPQSKFGFFEQHMVDILQESNESALEALGKMYPDVKEQELYAQLGAFGLQGAMARQPLSSLSGGQRVRYVFACLLMNCPHALLLDEPTNHLDLDAIEAMASNLESFSGAVVIVSHDMYFVKRLAKEHIMIVEKGKVLPLEKRMKKYAMLL